MYLRRDPWLDAAVVRHNAYKAMQCGSFGYTYGSHGLWYPNQNAEDQKFDNWGKPVPWWGSTSTAGRRTDETPSGVLTSRSTGGNLPHVPTPLAPRATCWFAPRAPKPFLLYFIANGKVADNARLRHVATGTSYEGTWFNSRTGEKIKRAAAIVADPTGLRLPSPPDKQDWMLILCKTPTAP